MSTVALPWLLPPLTKNKVRRMHFRTEANLRATALTEARAAITAANVKPIDRAVVILHWVMPNKVRRDGDGAQPSLSVCLDALVLEGVLADDSWAYVVHSGVTTHAPTKGQPGALWLTVQEVSP